MGDIALTAANIRVVDPMNAIIEPCVAGVTITAGQIVYGIVSSGKVGLADEDASAEASWVLGVALKGAVAGQTVDVLRRGMVAGFTVASLAYWLPCSLSNTAGALLDTGATTNIVARVWPTTEPDLPKALMFDCTMGTIAAVT